MRVLEVGCWKVGVGIMSMSIERMENFITREARKGMVGLGSGFIVTGLRRRRKRMDWRVCIEIDI